MNRAPKAMGPLGIITLVLMGLKALVDLIKAAKDK